MRTTTRDRLLLPVLVPVGLLVAIGLVLLGFSRILLSVSKTAATATALVTALAIVVLAAVVAGRRAVGLGSLAGLVGAVAGVAMLAGGLAVAVTAGGAVGEGGAGGGAAGPRIEVKAQGIAFDTDRLELPAETPVTIAFDNQDAGVQHNIAIYADDTLAEVLFKGELITGPARIEYVVPPLPAGEYYFHCDVHPNMNGVVVVSGGGTGPTGATGATGA